MAVRASKPLQKYVTVTRPLDIPYQLVTIQGLIIVRSINVRSTCESSRRMVTPRVAVGPEPDFETFSGMDEGLGWSDHNVGRLPDGKVSFCSPLVFLLHGGERARRDR